MADVFTHIEDNRDSYLDDLFELLAQPSVSAQDWGVEACADLLTDIVEGYGFDARQIETATYPLVYAEAEADSEGAPTVLFYGHYDVQPPGADEEWESPPFDPTVRKGSIYARGSGDNKGQLLPHVLAAAAVRETSGLGVNVKFLFEGEEESGSRGLIEWIRTDPDELQCDLIYLSDGPMHASRRPTLVYGNRGLAAFELSLNRANSGLHSGNFGGPVPNPANELVELLDSMVDGSTPTVDGVGEEVAVTDAQRELARQIPLDAGAIKRDLGLDSFTVPDERYYERLLLEPAVTINGLTAGYQGEGMKTVLPPEASAKVDIRLVPGQDPETVFEKVRAHVDAREPDVTVDRLGSFPPVATDPEVAVADDVLAALERAWNDEPVELPLLGGSLPAAYFRESVDVPILLVPYANPDQSNHAPNEHLDVDCFVNGIRTSAAFLEAYE